MILTIEEARTLLRILDTVIPHAPVAGVSLIEMRELRRKLAIRRADYEPEDAL